MQEEVDGVRVVHAPRSRMWLRGVAIVAGLVIVVLSGFSLEGLVVGPLVIGLGFWMSRRGEERGVWATADDLLVSNTGSRVRVPKEGATTTIVDVAPKDAHKYPDEPTGGQFFFRPHILFRPDLLHPGADDGLATEKRLYVIPGHADDEWVRVEAGIGLTPKRLRELAADIDAEIADRS